jgi:outer membrane scaffolding protein for murein synthesis (MipA/OmpV family)
MTGRGLAAYRGGPRFVALSTQVARAATLSSLLLVPAAALAESLPLWEAGAGFGVLSFPDYRGSDQSRTRAIPVPYLIYRGEIFKADRDGVRGKLFDSERLELNVSAGASFPVSSSDNKARRGMADLKPTVELGPALDINLWRTTDRRYKLDLRLPARAGSTVESSPKSVGWVFAPRVNLDIADIPGLPGWNLGMLAGPMYGDRRNHAYYYSVSTQDATASRPSYDAEGGYAGMQFLAAVSKRFPGYWVGGFIRYDTLAGAAFSDSPLLRQRYYVAGGLAIAWVFAESSRRVNADQ